MRDTRQTTVNCCMTEQDIPDAFPVDSNVARIDDAPVEDDLTDPTLDALHPNNYHQFLLQCGDEVQYSDEDYSDDSIGDDWYDEAFGEARGDFTKALNKARNDQTVNIHVPKTDSRSHILANQLGHRLKLDRAPPSTQLINSIKASTKKADGDKITLKDKSQRATVDQVLDPRTRLLMLKFVKNETLHEINGCISTGKEANVYHATDKFNRHFAVKVYKTSILVFKDRDRYVTGEHRFRHGYSKHNPRKMVKLWAEKEMRNLKRLAQAGIPSPDAIALRNHVLVMTLIGNNQGLAAPRLKDAPLTADQIPELYRQLVKIVWKMWHSCHLVHADLSEYNVLYYDDLLYVIDVSQSVEHDHPHAMEFLRKDVANVVEFFGRRLGRVMTVREMFDFVLMDIEALKAATPQAEQSLENVLDGDEKRVKFEATEKDKENVILDRYLDALDKEIASRPESYYATSEHQVAESVFKQTFLPRHLNEVVDIEGDIERMRDGGSVSYGDRLLSLAPEQPIKPQDEPTEKTVEISEPCSQSKLAEESSSSGSSDSETDSDFSDAVSRNKRDEDKDAKKARKLAVKEEKREKRKTKVPKAVKKRKEKQLKSKK